MSRIAAALVALTLMTASAAAYEPTIRIHCAAEGLTYADWRMRDGRYRIKLDGKWSDVPAGAVGPLFVMMTFDGAKCRKLAPPVRSR